MKNLDLVGAHIEQAGMCSKSLLATAQGIMALHPSLTASRRMEEIIALSRQAVDEMEMAMTALVDVDAQPRGGPPVCKTLTLVVNEMRLAA